MIFIIYIILYILHMQMCYVYYLNFVFELRNPIFVRVVRTQFEFRETILNQV